MNYVMLDGTVRRQVCIVIAQTAHVPVTLWKMPDELNAAERSPNQAGTACAYTELNQQSPSTFNALIFM